MPRKQIPITLAWIFVCAVLAGSLIAAEPADFSLREHLGHNWQRETVTFPIAGIALDRARAGRALVGEDGVSVPYQVFPGAEPGETRIASDNS